MVGEVGVEAAVARAHHDEWAFVVAATLRLTGDIDVAEECAQEAFASAVSSWTITGIPRRPGAWLTTVARRRAIDVLRRRSAGERLLTTWVEPEREPPLDDGEGSFPDDRLRLVFTCCHPALAREAQVALTLRLLCGLTTPEVARAFLVSDSTMAARLTRAKKRIRATRIPYRVPDPEDLPARVASVLDVIHLLFTAGYTAPGGSDLVRRDLVERATDLARMVRDLLPDDPEVASLLALILLTDARRPTRTDRDGRLLLLSEQDRALWDRDAIEEGVALVRDALTRPPAGRYALMAAVAALHARAPSWEETDWAEIVAIYDSLVSVWPSPVVALNRAVALGFAVGPAAGLAALEEVARDPQLASYAYLASTRADLLRRLGRRDEAREAYCEAIELTTNDVEREFLTARWRDLSS
jgi:RNA polymerase sigma factor (sigma-70 family)